MTHVCSLPLLHIHPVFPPGWDSSPCSLTQAHTHSRSRRLTCTQTHARSRLFTLVLAHAGSVDFPESLLQLLPSYNFCPPFRTAFPSLWSVFSLQPWGWLTYPLWLINKFPCISLSTFYNKLKSLIFFFFWSIFPTLWFFKGREYFTASST